MDQEEPVPFVANEVGRLVFGLAVAARGHAVAYGIPTHNASPDVIGGDRGRNAVEGVGKSLPSAAILDS